MPVPPMDHSMSKKINIETAEDPDTQEEAPKADGAKASEAKASDPKDETSKAGASSTKARKPSRKKKKKTAKTEEAPSDKSVPEDEAAQEQAEEETAQVYKERLLRLQADFENFRRRTQRDRSDLYRMANEDLMEDLLPVIDHIELALDAAGTDEQSKALADGVKLVLDQFEGTLKKFNLEPIDAVGEAFDPNLHEALSQAPSEEFNDQVVMFQHRRGYKLGAKLLRAAQVVISLGPGPGGDETPADAEAEAAETVEEN